MHPLMSYARCCALALAATLVFGGIVPAAASVATSSAISESVELSVNTISNSVKRSSNSSSGTTVAEGDYRVTRLTLVTPELREVTLQAVPGTGAQGELVLHMPERAVHAGGIAIGERITARQRPYGYELARSDTQQAFFLLLDDPWYKELQSVVVRM